MTAGGGPRRSGVPARAAAPGARPASAHGRARRRRLPKRVLRIFAWIAGVASFLSPWAGLAGPPEQVSATPHVEPQVILKRKVIKRRVIVQVPSRVPPQPIVRYVYVPGATTSSSGGSSGASNPPATQTKGS